MPKYRVDQNDQEVIEALALAALMVMDIVEKAKTDKKEATPADTKTPPETDNEKDR